MITREFAGKLINVEALQEHSEFENILDRPVCVQLIEADDKYFRVMASTGFFVGRLTECNETYPYLVVKGVCGDAEVHVRLIVEEIPELGEDALLAKMDCYEFIRNQMFFNNMFKHLEEEIKRRFGENEDD